MALKPSRNKIYLVISKDVKKAVKSNLLNIVAICWSESIFLEIFTKLSKDRDLLNEGEVK